VHRQGKQQKIRHDEADKQCETARNKTKENKLATNRKWNFWIVADKAWVMFQVVAIKLYQTL